MAALERGRGIDQLGRSQDPEEDIDDGPKPRGEGQGQEPQANDDRIEAQVGGDAAGDPGDEPLGPAAAERGPGRARCALEPGRSQVKLGHRRRSSHRARGARHR